jgi:MFS family permease
LIGRFGTVNMMVTGIGLLGASVSVNLLGGSVGHFWLALVLLGVGWNFLFVGATTLLTETYVAAEKAKVQGVNDLLVFGTVALAATASGMLHHALGWQAMNIGVVPLLVFCLFTLYVVHRPRTPVFVQPAANPLPPAGSGG